MGNDERCSREELDRAIEWLLEVQNVPREKLKDEDEAEELIYRYSEWYWHLIPDNIYTEDFLAAWNEYIDQYPARTKVMFSWDQFFSLSRADRSTLAFCYEVMDSPYESIPDFGAGDAWQADDDRIWDYYDMLAWLIDCASPHFKALEPGDPLLREYVQTGHVHSCPHCGSHDIQAYGYAFRTKGSVLLICPRCGAVGRHRGLKVIHRHGDPDCITFWPNVQDDDFFTKEPYLFDTPDHQQPAPEDYGIRGETEE